MSTFTVSRRVRRIVPPEGVPLTFEISATGERLLAFLIDVVVVGVVCLVAALLGGLAGSESLGTAFAILALFLITNFYFIVFEIRGQGRTLGKRALGLRVIDRRGGALSGEAIFARNFLRQVEILGPLVVVSAPDALWPGAAGWLRVCGVAWLVVFAVMPWLNRDRMRVGDLVAGTLVVKSPLPVALAQGAASRRRSPVADPRYRFSAAQLGVYGVYELQILEDVLRNRRQDRKALETVCAKIQSKIGWDPTHLDVDPLDFLTDFYEAQRAQLEAQMLMGERREHKKTGRLHPRR